MKRFVAGESRSQATLFPELLDDFVTEDNPVRAIEVFVDALDRNQPFKTYAYSPSFPSKSPAPTLSDGSS